MKNNNKISIIVTLLTVVLFGIAVHHAGGEASRSQKASRPSGGTSLSSLASTGKVKIDSVGTGETIGHVVDLKIKNLTDQPIKCAVGPMVLESISRKNQDYVCPTPQTVTIEPHRTATVPMNGVCINRNKPPVGKGAPGDLLVNTGDPTGPQNPNSHLPVNQAGDLLRICTAKYNAADQLQKSGALKNLPYQDPQKQKDIVVQWSTWMDPRISQITGAPPATKDDLKKVVYKQLESKKPMTPETKKKVDQGIDTIFEKVELTTAKAKDLEKPEKEIPPGAGTTVAQTPSAGQPVSAPTGAPGETVAGTPTATPQGPGATTTQPTATPTPSPTPTPIAIGDTNAHQQYLDDLDKKGGKEDLIAVEEHVRPQTEWTREYVNTSKDCWKDFHVCITDDKGQEGTFNFASMTAGFRDATITVGGEEHNMKFEEKEGSHKEGKYNKCAYIILDPCVKPGQSVTFNCIVGCYGANGTGCRYHLEVRASTDGK
jgi:hypothetical protein